MRKRARPNRPASGQVHPSARARICAPGAVHRGGDRVQRVAQRRPGRLGRRSRGSQKPQTVQARRWRAPAAARHERAGAAAQPRTVAAGTPSAAATARWPRPAIARPAAAPMTSMPSARRGAHQAAARYARPVRQDRHRARRGRPPRPPARRAAGPPVPARIPTGPAGLARRARQRPGRQVSGRGTGIQAQQHGRQVFPVVSVIEPSLPGTGRPGQGAFVLQHAPPPPGPQPESRTLP